MPNEHLLQTQRVELEDCAMPARCALHIRRIDMLEMRMNAHDERMQKVEKLHEILQGLAADVRVLSERVKLLLWVGGAIASAIIIALVTAAFKLHGG